MRAILLALAMVGCELDGSRIASVTICDGEEPGIVLDEARPDPEDVSAFSFSYYASQFGNGNTLASASVYGRGESSSRTVLYAPLSDDYQAAPVALDFDVYGAKTSGRWKLSLDRNAPSLLIEYSDSDLPLLSWKEICTVTRY